MDGMYAVSAVMFMTRRWGTPMRGSKKGVPFEELPEDWVCPICGAAKDEFTPE